MQLRYSGAVLAKIMASFDLRCASKYNTLTANYSVKQNQLIKLTSESRARNPEKSNESFDRAIRE